MTTVPEMEAFCVDVGLYTTYPAEDDRSMTTFHWKLQEKN